MCGHGLYMFFEHEVQFEFILPFVFKSMPLSDLDSLLKDGNSLISSHYCYVKLIVLCIRDNL